MPKPLKKTPTKPKSARPPRDVNQWARHRVDESTAEPEAAPTAIAPAALSAYMSELGRKGGQVSGSRRMQNISPERRQEIALKAARSRWAKRKKVQ